MVDSDSRHSLPIGQMGNYQDYLKKQPQPLRELESQPVRQHMFGNPFKINKNLMMTDEVSGIVDEVQLVGVSGSPQSGTPVGRGIKRPADQALHPAPPKRRKGPLTKDFQYVSPSSSPRPGTPDISPPPLISSPSPAPLPIPPLSPSPASLTNGVVLPGLGSVYPGGKMAAFRSLCDSDQDSDGESPSLVILEETLKPHHPEPPVELLDPQENLVKSLILKPKPIVPICPVDDPTPAPLPIHIPPQELLESDLIKPIVNGDNNGVEEPEMIDLVEEDGKETIPSPEQGDQECLSVEELRSIRLRNNNARQLIYKEVKKPGKKHEELLEMLGKLHGPHWIRRQFIEEVRLEAVRFKRRELAELLQKRVEILSKLKDTVDR